MLDAIRYAAAGVAKKDYVSALTHFKIQGGRITAFNGKMSLSSDIPIDIDAIPHAASFLAAVKAAGDEPISLHVTPAGRLAVRAGKFRAFVNCVPDGDQSVTYLEPQGESVDLGSSFLSGLKAVAPVMGVDASRPWAMGVKLSSKSMFASNNVMIVQFWHGAELPFDVVLPAHAVNELLRVGQEPSRVQVSANTVTFWFGEHRWLLTTVMEGTLWPLDKIEGLLDERNAAQCAPLPDGFFDGVATLEPFLDAFGRVFVTPDGLRTSMTDGEGATVDVAMPGVPQAQPYGYKQLSILGRVATGVDWTGYPKPCKFSHKDHPLRGVIVGQRA